MKKKLPPTVLIANRGEIATRIVHAAQKIGARAVVVVSAADVDSLAARIADEVVTIGGPAATDSYLIPEYVAQAALHCGADVVHPGYGFLSEQADLVRMLEDEGIAFAGPRAETMEAVGDKSSARRVAKEAGLPLAPARRVRNLHEAPALASEIGYPVLIKAVFGGGGRGIRLANSEQEVRNLVSQAATEAKAAFGNGALYLERYYSAARHVEVQIFGDGEGKAWIFGDRDCSVQRRHQKLVEECPAPGLTPEQREILHSTARSLVEHLKYRGAGTVEYLVDTESDAIIFLEVNARIQVEHPVTEEAYGIDLVAAQLRLALGIDPGLPTVEPTPSSSVIEIRVNAEDPDSGFSPKPGRVTEFRVPQGPGIRFDTHLYAGYDIPPYYDSLLGKLIVRGYNRQQAIESLLAAARNIKINGIPTTLSASEFVLSHKVFQAGGVPTTWFEKAWEEYLAGTDD